MNNRWCKVWRISYVMFWSSKFQYVVSCNSLSKILSRRQVRAVPSPRGDLVGLAPPNKAPSPPNWNMKHYVSGMFVKFECQAPLHKRKAPPVDDFLATVLGQGCSGVGTRGKVSWSSSIVLMFGHNTLSKTGVILPLKALVVIFGYCVSCCNIIRFFRQNWSTSLFVSYGWNHFSPN